MSGCNFYHYNYDKKKDKSKKDNNRVVYGGYDECEICVEWEKYKW